MTNGTRFTLRDLPLPAKLVLTVFLMAIGLGYISAMMQLHFRSGSRDGNPLPTVKDVVRRYAGSDWPPNGKADDIVVVKKEEPKRDAPPAKKEQSEPKDGTVAAIKIKSLIAARCAECHRPDGEEDTVLLDTYEHLAKFLKPIPANSKMHKVLNGPVNKWGKDSMVRAFTDKDNDWKSLIQERPEAEIRTERDAERRALIAWVADGAKKEQYDANAFPLPDALAKEPLTEDFKTRFDPNAKPGEAPKEKEVVRDPLVGVDGPLKVKIQTLITTRCAECHKTDKKDTPLVTFADLQLLLVPSPKQGKLHKVITGAPNRWGKDSMVRAFTDKSIGWKEAFQARPTEVKQEREMEQIALLAWLEAGAPKEAYEQNEFIVPAEKVKGPITKSLMVGAPEPVNPMATLRQIDFDSLVQSTHAHILTFALLWTATGLIFAFTSYPLWMRVVIAPSVLLAQVLDVLCWWLARLPDVGPYFAVAILGTGAIVGLGVSLQLLLSMFDLYGGKGKLILFLICALGALGLGAVAVKYIEPELTVEKKEGGAKP